MYTNNSITLTQDYVSGFVYKNSSLDFFSTEAGRVKKVASGSLQYQYNLTDHLGNTRVMFADTGATPNGTADMLEYNSYYAFGMRIEGLSTTNPDNKFTYNGKELEDDFGLNWYHYGARYYDAQLGRWHTTDPVDEFYSPYIYVANNPARWTDPDGRSVDFEKKDDAIAVKDALNSMHEGLNLSLSEITEKKSILFGLIEWEVTTYRLSSEGSDFDFSQNKYTMALYDVINSKDYTFNLKIVPDDYKGMFDVYTMYDKGGGEASSFKGGSNILLSMNNRVNDPFGVVVMHELVGHGHPAGGNNAHDINRFYNPSFTRSYGYRHPGYHDGIGWRPEQMNLFKMPIQK